MSGPIGHQDGDMDEFDDVRRRYRQEAITIEPPVVLDAAILAAAHRAVGARPAATDGRRGGWRWQAPLAAAAVVVLATSLAVLFFEEGAPLPERDLPPPARAPGVAAPGLQTGADHAAAAPAGEVMPAPGAVASAPPPAARKARTYQNQAPTLPETRTAAEDAPAPTAEAASHFGQTADAVRPSAPAAASAPAPVAAERARASAADERSAAAPRGAELLPERVLEQIRGLWDAGRRDEAARRFARFLEDFPDYPVPADYPVPRPRAP